MTRPDLSSESSLVRTNSWAPFLHEMEAILRSRDFRFQTILRLLQQIFPEIENPKRSWSDCLKGWLLGPGFASGRRALYFSLFRSFAAMGKPLFHGAPLPVITTFNRLVETLFASSGDFKPLLLDPETAYRKKSRADKLLESGSIHQKNLGRWLAESGEHPFPESEGAQSILDRFLDQEPSSQEEAPLVPIDHFFLGPGLASFERRLRSLPEGEREEAVQSIQQALKEYSQTLQRWVGYRLLHGRTRELMPFPDDIIESRPADRIIAYLNEQRLLLLAEIEKFGQLQGRLRRAEKEKERLIQKLEPFHHRIELKDRVDDYIARIQYVKLASERPPEAAVEEFERSTARLGAEIEELFGSFIAEMAQNVIAMQQARACFYVKKWNILTLQLLYPDLLALCRPVQKKVISELFQLSQRAFVGALSEQDYRAALEGYSYDSDMILIRAEQTQRAKRIVDIRAVMKKELEAIDFLAAAGALLDLKEALLPIGAFRGELYGLYKAWADPQKIFSSVDSPEDINVIFRSSWVQIEGWQARKADVEKDFLRAFLSTISQKGLPSVREALLYPILRTVARLDAVLASKKISSSAYAQFEEAFQQLFTDVYDLQSLEESMRQLARLVAESSKKWSPVFCFALELCRASPVALQDDIIERLSDLYRKREAIFNFGKTIQAVSTDDEEYVGGLLGLFQHADLFLRTGFFSGLWHQVLETVDSAFDRIERFLFIHFGTLDEKALFARPDLMKSCDEAMRRLEFHFASGNIYLYKKIFDAAARESVQKLSSKVLSADLIQKYALMSVAEALLMNNALSHPVDVAWIVSWAGSALLELLDLHPGHVDLKKWLSEKIVEQTEPLYQLVLQWSSGVAVSDQSEVFAEGPKSFDLLTELPEIAEMAKDFFASTRHLLSKRRASDLVAGSHFRPYMLGDLNLILNFEVYVEFRE